MNKLKILELFSGKESFSKVARERGHKTFTIDINPLFNPDLCINILDFNISMLKGFEPDVIWASPPCETFSVASIGKHWDNNKTPKSKEAEEGLKILNKTLEIISELNPEFWIIENPRCMTRRFLPEIYRTTVTYCQYGDSRMKPTDLWNNFGFIGKSCKNGDSCHISSPRGSKTGTQGLKNNISRSKVPKKLCEEILNKIEETKQNENK